VRDEANMEKILVVEDDESLARGIRFALEREGFQIIPAVTIHEGEKLFHSQTFDLILLDITLPDGNGFELCKRIRKSSRTPIIFLTACDEEVNIVLGLDIGADDYITKPFRVRELISRIRAVLRRTSTSSSVMNSSLLKSGNVVVNFLQRKIYKNNYEILLTPMEFKLISILCQNPLQVLTRNQILENIWDIDGEFIDDNTLSVHIRRLREKLEDDPSNPDFIVTVRGIGYKWNQECV